MAQIKSKKVRFVVFERDNFTCQYCGRIPPNVVLELDHIYPKSKGGKDEIENLLTSCFDCNRGKRDLVLGSIPKQVSKNITDIKEKQEQMEAFYKYQQKINKSVNKKINKLAKVWASVFENKFSLNARGRATVKFFLKYLSEDEIEESMYIASGKFPMDIERGFKYFCGVLHNKKNGINPTLYGKI